MKTKVIGWLYLIASIGLLILSIYSVYGAEKQFSLYATGGSIQANIGSYYTTAIYAGLVSIVLSIIVFIWSIALIRHKKWSWYFGVVLICLLLAGNIIYEVFFFSGIYLVAILFNLFVLYSLWSEKQQFISRV